jgi:predicted NodU family carbamoyl transferase
MIANRKKYTLEVCNGETSSACLFNDRILIGTVSEERFTRKKYDR